MSGRARDILSKLLEPFRPFRLATSLTPIGRRYEKTITVLAAAFGVTAVLLNFEMNLLEANLYDLRVSAGVSAPADPNIVMITLDDVSTKTLDALAPLPLSFHAELMESLERYEPRAVGYLVDFNQVSHLAPEQFQGPISHRFMQSARRLRGKGTALLLGTPFDVTGEVVPPYPLSRLPHSIAVIHKDGNVFSEDKVTRRALVSLNDVSAFHIDLARQLGLMGASQIPRGTFTVPEIEARYFFFRYHGDTVLNPLERGELPYPRYSFTQVLRGEVPVEALRGKVLLIGTLMRDSSIDFAFTPYSKAPFANPKILIHANILDSVIHDAGMLRPHPWLNALTTFSLTAFVLWWVLSLTPLYGVFATVSLSIAFMAMCQILFSWKGIWLRESQPLVGIFVGYYLAVPYRLIREYRKRWEYQRKNAILTQVEELKTNFLSLVTHDLKTPVARIQGLAEVLLRKAGERLIERDRETIHSIISATDELNRFISSILELSKVESQKLYLNVESKDINQLIERCVEGFKAPARAKRIKLDVKLEPLFPIRIDASLISKVLNNLIDNALKYSPRESEIQIESRETDGWVEISVRDRGIGMTAEEKENLFTRFYRAKNDHTASTAGTGLGLYLTRYFVEAHGGRVEVESERGQGSRFIIVLPVEGAAKGAVAEPAIAPEPAKGLTRRLRAVVKEFSRQPAGVDVSGSSKE